jgi:hypothetical protein
MVSSYQRFQAGASIEVVEMLAKLDHLVHPAVSIAQICPLRLSEVEAKALG